MKVLLINGSPNKKGCTYTALCEAEKELNKQKIETEILYLGQKPIRGCTACGKCLETGKCVFDDTVNVALEKAAQSDGFVFGSPVHYAGASGFITSFLDRCFFAGSDVFAYKPGAAIVSCRRGGATAALDQLNKYFTIQEMPVVSSRYWNMVHGANPEQIKQDLEGMQVMRVLGNNMAFFLHCKNVALKMGISMPKQEPMVFTNFIR